MRKIASLLFFASLRVGFLVQCCFWVFNKNWFLWVLLLSMELQQKPLQGWAQREKNGYNHSKSWACPKIQSWVSFIYCCVKTGPKLSSFKNHLIFLRGKNSGRAQLNGSSLSHMVSAVCGRGEEGGGWGWCIHFHVVLFTPKLVPWWHGWRMGLLGFLSRSM